MKFSTPFMLFMKKMSYFNCMPDVFGMFRCCFKHIKYVLKKNKIKILGKNNILCIDDTARIEGCYFDVCGDENTIEIGSNVKLKNVRFYIRGNNHEIIINNNVQFKQKGEIWIEDEHNHLIIGEYTTFEQTHLAVTENNSCIRIGKYCMFSVDIDVRNGDSHSILDLKSNKRINFADDIIIGDHVWVGAGVSILKGTLISTDSIVATRSVVTKKFSESNIIIGGIPAVKLKDGITWDRKRIY